MREDLSVVITSSQKDSVVTVAVGGNPCFGVGTVFCHNNPETTNGK